MLGLIREKNKLERSLGGIRDMNKVPSAIWVVDTNKEHIAVGEARKLGIPVIAILDTNCDPDEVDYPIPGNDDAIRSAALLTRVIASAVAEGLQAAPVWAAATASPRPKLPSRCRSGSKNSWPRRRRLQNRSPPKPQPNRPQSPPRKG
ncbi:ribosomal protein S2 [Mycobacterium xenopi 3993]|nr:ribosomal protein S2 [Mycobacterium xenopi 3993]